MQKDHLSLDKIQKDVSNRYGYQFDAKTAATIKWAEGGDFSSSFDDWSATKGLAPQYEKAEDLERRKREYAEGAKGLTGAVKSGVRQAGAATRVMWNVLTGDEEEAREVAERAQWIPKTDAQMRFLQAGQENRAEARTRGDDPDEDFGSAFKTLMGTIWDEPQGALHEVGTQLPNSAPGIAGMFAGGLAGAKIGAKVGAASGLATGGLSAVPGAAAGALAGSVIGMFIGNYGIETGHIAQEAIAEGDYDRGQILKQGAIKTGVITGVDTATMLLTAGMFKAVNNSVRRVIKNRVPDIDFADDTAIAMALRQNEGLAEEVAKAGGLAALQNAPKGFAGKMAHTAGTGLEMFGEGAGEYLGSNAAGLEASMYEAVMESVMSAPQSAVSTIGSRLGAKLTTEKSRVDRLNNALDKAKGDDFSGFAEVSTSDIAMAAKTAGDLAAKNEGDEKYRADAEIMEAARMGRIANIAENETPENIQRNIDNLEDSISKKPGGYMQRRMEAALDLFREAQSVIPGQQREQAPDPTAPIEPAISTQESPAEPSQVSDQQAEFNKRAQSSALKLAVLKHLPVSQDEKNQLRAEIDSEFDQSTPEAGGAQQSLMKVWKEQHEAGSLVDTATRLQALVDEAEAGNPERLISGLEQLGISVNNPTEAVSRTSTIINDLLSANRQAQEEFAKIQSSEAGTRGAKAAREVVHGAMREDEVGGDGLGGFGAEAQPEVQPDTAAPLVAEDQPQQAPSTDQFPDARQMIETPTEQVTEPISEPIVDDLDIDILGQSEEIENVPDDQLGKKIIERAVAANIMPADNKNAKFEDFSTEVSQAYKKGARAIRLLTIGSGDGSTLGSGPFKSTPEDWKAGTQLIRESWQHSKKAGMALQQWVINAIKTFGKSFKPIINRIALAEAKDSGQPFTDFTEKDIRDMATQDVWLSDLDDIEGSASRTIEELQGVGEAEVAAYNDQFQKEYQKFLKMKGETSRQERKEAVAKEKAASKAKTTDVKQQRETRLKEIDAELTQVEAQRGELEEALGEGQITDEVSQQWDALQARTDALTKEKEGIEAESKKAREKEKRVKELEKKIQAWRADSQSRPAMQAPAVTSSINPVSQLQSEAAETLDSARFLNGQLADIERKISEAPTGDKVTEVGKERLSKLKAERDALKKEIKKLSPTQTAEQWHKSWRKTIHDETPGAFDDNGKFADSENLDVDVRRAAGKARAKIKERADGIAAILRPSETTTISPQRWRTFRDAVVNMEGTGDPASVFQDMDPDIVETEVLDFLEALNESVFVKKEIKRDAVLETRTFKTSGGQAVKVSVPTETAIAHIERFNSALEGLHRFAAEAYFGKTVDVGNDGVPVATSDMLLSVLGKNFRERFPDGATLKPKGFFLAKREKRMNKQGDEALYSESARRDSLKIRNALLNLVGDIGLTIRRDGDVFKLVEATKFEIEAARKTSRASTMFAWEDVDGITDADWAFYQNFSDDVIEAYNAGVIDGNAQGFVAGLPAYEGSVPLYAMESWTRTANILPAPIFVNPLHVPYIYRARQKYTRNARHGMGAGAFENKDTPPSTMRDMEAVYRNVVRPNMRDKLVNTVSRGDKDNPKGIMGIASRAVELFSSGVNLLTGDRELSLARDDRGKVIRFTQEEAQSRFQDSEMSLNDYNKRMEEFRAHHSARLEMILEAMSATPEELVSADNDVRNRLIASRRKKFAMGTLLQNRIQKVKDEIAALEKGAPKKQSTQKMPASVSRELQKYPNAYQLFNDIIEMHKKHVNESGYSVEYVRDGLTRKLGDPSGPFAFMQSENPTNDTERLENQQAQQALVRAYKAWAETSQAHPSITDIADSVVEGKASKSLQAARQRLQNLEEQRAAVTGAWEMASDIINALKSVDPDSANIKHLEDRYLPKRSKNGRIARADIQPGYLISYDGKVYTVDSSGQRATAPGGIDNVPLREIAESQDASDTTEYFKAQPPLYELFTATWARQWVEALAHKDMAENSTTHPSELEFVTLIKAPVDVTRMTPEGMETRAFYQTRMRVFKPLSDRPFDFKEYFVSDEEMDLRDWESAATTISQQHRAEGRKELVPVNVTLALMDRAARMFQGKISIPPAIREAMRPGGSVNEYRVLQALDGTKNVSVKQWENMDVSERSRLVRDAVEAWKYRALNLLTPNQKTRLSEEAHELLVEQLENNPKWAGQLAMEIRQAPEGADVSFPAGFSVSLSEDQRQTLIRNIVGARADRSEVAEWLTHYDPQTEYDGEGPAVPAIESLALKSDADLIQESIRESLNTGFFQEIKKLVGIDEFAGTESSEIAKRFPKIWDADKLSNQEKGKVNLAQQKLGKLVEKLETQRRSKVDFLKRELEKLSPESDRYNEASAELASIQSPRSVYNDAGVQSLMTEIKDVMLKAYNQDVDSMVRRYTVARSTRYADITGEGAMGFDVKKIAPRVESWYVEERTGTTTVKVKKPVKRDKAGNLIDPLSDHHELATIQVMTSVEADTKPGHVIAEFDDGKHVLVSSVELNDVLDQTPEFQAFIQRELPSLYQRFTGSEVTVPPGTAIDSKRIKMSADAVKRSPVKPGDIAFDGFRIQSWKGGPPKIVMVLKQLNEVVEVLDSNGQPTGKERVKPFTPEGQGKYDKSHRPAGETKVDERSYPTPVYKWMPYRRFEVKLSNLTHGEFDEGGWVSTYNERHISEEGVIENKESFNTISRNDLMYMLNNPELFGQIHVKNFDVMSQNARIPPSVDIWIEGEGWVSFSMMEGEGSDAGMAFHGEDIIEAPAVKKGMPSSGGYENVQQQPSPVLHILQKRHRQRIGYRTAQSPLHVTTDSKADMAGAKKMGQKIKNSVRGADKSNIVFHESFDALPAEMKDMLIQDGAEHTAMAWTNKDTGQIHVIVNRHTDNSDVGMSLVHELVAHRGLRGVMPKDVSYDSFLDSVFKTYKDLAQPIYANIAKRFEFQNRYVESDSAAKLEAQRLAAEEVVAGLLEQAEITENGVITNKEVGTYLDRVVSFVMKGLRKLGLVSEQRPLGRYEIRALIARAYKGRNVKYEWGITRTLDEFANASHIQTFGQVKDFGGRLIEKMAGGLADYAVVINAMQRIAKKEGVFISEHNDAYGKFGIFKAKTGAMQQERLYKKHAVPLIAKLKKYNLTDKDKSHNGLAEAMRQVLTVDKNRSVNLDNITLPKGLTKAGFLDILSSVDAINRDMLDIMESFGMRTSEAFAWAKIQAHHIDGKRYMVSPPPIFVQNDLTRQEIESGSPLVASLHQLQVAINQAHKNDAKLSLLRLIRSIPKEHRDGIAVLEPKGTKVQAEIMFREMGLKGVDVENAINFLDISDKLEGDYMGVWENGQFRKVHIKNLALMKAIRDMNGQQLGRVANLIGQGNRLMALSMIKYNPLFWPVNFIRDTQSAIAHLHVGGQAMGLPEGIAKTVSRNIFKAGNAAFKYHKGATDREVSGYSKETYDNFVADGGLTGVSSLAAVDFDKADLSQIRDGLASSRNTLTQNIINLRDPIERLVNAFCSSSETAARLALYDTLIKDHGWSRHDAMQQAKNLTVNFDRRGSYTILNQLYLFFNAAVQGGVSSAKWMLGDKKKAKRLAQMMVGAGFMFTELGKMAMGEDDDGELIFDKISEHDKRTGFLIPTGWLTGDPRGYLKIPKPYVFGFFFDIGGSMSDMMRGRNPLASMANLAGSSTMHFFPMNPGVQINEMTDTSRYLAHAVTPTLANPPLELLFGQDAYSGREIFNGEKTAWENTQFAMRQLARGYMGGAGDLASMMPENLAAAAQGTYFSQEPHRTPFKRFVGRVPNFVAQQSFYSVKDDMVEATSLAAYYKNKAKKALTDDLKEEFLLREQEVREKNPAAFGRTKKEWSRVNGKVQRIRAQIDAERAGANNRAKIRNLEDQMVDLMLPVVKQYNEVMPR